MEPAIKKPRPFLPIAKDVWETVRECYSELENSYKIFDLKTRLWQSKQGNQDVTMCYNLMATLWQEFDRYYEDD